MKKASVQIDGLEVRVLLAEERDFICITDIAKRFEVGVAAIESWMRNRNTVEFLGTWESLYNPDFNSVGFDGIRANVGLNTFKISVKKWIDETGAIGIEAKTGKYGGTYAHKDIALQFCYWLSPSFQLFFIREFQRLKMDESRRLDTGWDLRRQLAKINFQLHAEAVRQHLVPPIDWNTRREAIYQASEADLLNLALFGITAREWQAAYPTLSGNLRDHASAEQLLVLANLESLNSKLLEWNMSREQRLEVLNQTGREQMELLVRNASVRALSAG